MRKRIGIAAVLLVIAMIITTCQNKDSRDLFPRQQEVNEIAKDSTLPEATPAATAASDGMEATVGNKPTTASEPEASMENESEGDTMETIGTNIVGKFYCEEISDEIKGRIIGKSYGDNCDVPFDELRYVKVLYWGFDEEVHEGELIVNQFIAEDIVDIFKELYELKYPIERMVLVDEYDADDNTSMAANNTSSFNYRNVDGTNHLSLHSYGLAIDINPRYNPYVREMDGEKVITPENGKEYADRELDCPYYIKKGDPIYEIFIDHGFTWGGEWKNQKDYQHFQKKP